MSFFLEWILVVRINLAQDYEWILFQAILQILTRITPEK
jgi:hypothetical protein